MHDPEKERGSLAEILSETRDGEIRPHRTLAARTADLYVRPAVEPCPCCTLGEVSRAFSLEKSSQEITVVFRLSQFFLTFSSWEVSIEQKSKRSRLANPSLKERQTRRSICPLVAAIMTVVLIASAVFGYTETRCLVSISLRQQAVAKVPWVCVSSPCTLEYPVLVLGNAWSAR